jgi:hypothetical protein
MLKYKAGLHKDVSAIFKGVSLPNENAAPPPTAPAVEGHQDSIAPKPPEPKPAGQGAPPPSQKLPAPSNLTANKHKAAQPNISQPAKPAADRQPKAGVASKSARQPAWQKKFEQIKGSLLAPKAGGNSTRQKVTMILVPILFVVLIFIFIQFFIATPSRKITGGRKEKPAKSAAAAATNNKVEWKIPEPYPTEIRDPMQFGPVTPHSGGGSSGIVVKGIVYSKDNPCAVIGDQVLHQGDKVLGVSIVKINENSVEFEVNGKKWTQAVQR